MRHGTQWLLALGVAAGGARGGAPTFAQPNARDHRGQNPPPAAAPPPAADHDRRRPPPAAAPTEAPPPPRAEAAQARAGFVWVPGHWDWRGHWEWVPGRAEREHRGQKWREARWDHQGDQWVFSDGGWIDAGEVKPADDYPRDAPPPARDEHIAPRSGFVWAA